MGKPFAAEIDKLRETYNWALKEDISALVDVLKSTFHLPLLSVGSGGSYSAAVLQSSLHRHCFRSLAMAVTPVEMIQALPQDGVASVWLLSAGGNNIDLRRAFQHAVVHEPRCVSALVGREHSKVAALGKRFNYANVFEHPIPSGKDGFLATNSLVAFSVLLCRAYIEASGKVRELPNEIEGLMALALPASSDLNQLYIKTNVLLGQRTLHVVYSEKLKSTAVDIESKFVEAGLGSVHLADLRNFAHGRHHWFSKNSSSCGILFLASETDRVLAGKTLDLLPDTIEKVHINFSDQAGAELIAGIVLSIYMTKWRGNHFNVDPGRPGVPDYGSKIYRLSSNPGFVTAMPLQTVAIRRKARYLSTLPATMESWRQSYKVFSRRLSKQLFSGLVMDYDGTLIDRRSRDGPPSSEICSELNRLLNAGIVIGFATGRGKSIRESLQTLGVIDKEFWNRVFVGYYNGSEIGLLSDNGHPDSIGRPCEKLEGISNLLAQNLDICALDPEVTERKYQITVQPRMPAPETHLWETISSILHAKRSSNIQVLRSSHSVDIIAPEVSKLAVLTAMSSIVGSEDSILTIGDRGRWPGNDSTLLSTKFSLSVDEVSSEQQSCWNLCTAGLRGPQGALEYLKRLKCVDGFMYYS